MKLLSYGGSESPEKILLELGIDVRKKEFWQKGFDEEIDGAFNVTTAHRQPGSAIKPINYAIGIERKIVNPATVFLDVPTCFFAAGQPIKYCPHNYDGVFHGMAQLRFALGNSYNIPAVKMLAINGVENFVASASAFTITSFKDPKNYGLSLTLGGGEVKMTELAQAFSSFANRGIPKKLISILEVKNKKGENSRITRKQTDHVYDRVYRIMQSIWSIVIC